MALSSEPIEQVAPAEPAAGNIVTVSFVGQVISGGALLALLTLHMIAHHFVVPNGLRNYAEVVDYLRNPVIVVLEVLFLCFVTWHAMLGVRAVIFDWGLSARVERRITWILTVVGIATVAYGLWLTAVVVSKG